MEDAGDEAVAEFFVGGLDAGDFDEVDANPKDHKWVGVGFRARVGGSFG